MVYNIVSAVYTASFAVLRSNWSLTFFIGVHKLCLMKYFVESYIFPFVSLLLRR